MTTLTLVPKARITVEQSPRPPLLARFVEYVVRHPWPERKSVDSVLARAIEEAFESLAREARS